MTTLPALAIERTDLALPTEDIEAGAGYARSEKAEITRIAYRSDFAIFREWCQGKGVSALPASPATVPGFLAREADRGRAPVPPSATPIGSPTCRATSALPPRLGRTSESNRRSPPADGVVTMPRNGPRPGRRGISVFKMRDVAAQVHRRAAGLCARRGDCES
jgi:hypothetical protein